MDDMAELRALIELASRAIEKQFKSVGRVFPMYHAIPAHGPELIIKSPHKDKDTAVAMVKLLFVQHNVQRYVFMDEAWRLDTKNRLPSASEIAKIEREGLRNHPDRREILMFQAEDRRGNILTAHRYILRPEHGKAKLTPLEIQDMTGALSHGRMVGLLR